MFDWLTSMFGLKPSSNTAIAASEPEPMNRNNKTTYSYSYMHTQISVSNNHLGIDQMIVYK